MNKVLKFGGTSVGSAENMKQVASIVRREGGRVTVLSAMSGMTNGLLEIAARAARGDCAGAEALLDTLREKYTACIEGLLTGLHDEALERMRQTDRIILGEVAAFRPVVSERTIVAQGELLTTAIFTLYLQECGLKALCLAAPEFMTTDAEGKVDTEALRNRLTPLVTDPDVFYVTQGFISTDDRGAISNLGRGGSDYSAALIGAAIDASEVQIWTDIDGMHNNDPRYVENTYPIRRMSFDEAAELAYFGASILHPSAIQPCKDKGIPVLLRNTMDPDAPGTTISAEEDDSRPFHAVAAKDGITVIRIYSARMLMAYGFLRKVFEVFESHRTPIDMITTSEVAVSITIDNDAHLDAIVWDLQPLGSIEIERDNSIVCVVGRFDHKDSGTASQVLNGIRQVPIKMISYGASHRSISLLIDTAHKKQTLQELNDTLFSCQR